MSLYNLWMCHPYHVTSVTRLPRANPQHGNLLFGEIQFVCENADGIRPLLCNRSLEQPTWPLFVIFQDFDESI